ncbi:MAG: hypothetical protein C4326_13770 [Ignavibacteria bacterium]
MGRYAQPIWTMSRSLPIVMGFLILATVCSLHAQEQARDFRIVFDEIQHGFETGNISSFSSRFAQQLRIDLKGEGNRYCSANQAFYILENFLKTRKVLSFEFTNVGANDDVPFASGVVVFSQKGAKETSHIYVSLMPFGKGWVIAEITLY